MQEFIVGLDIGGTTMKIGLFKLSGELMQKWEIPTNSRENGRNIVNDIYQSVNKALQKMNIKNDNLLGIGVGAPGFVDTKTGMVYEAVNIGWLNFCLGEKLEELFNVPVFVENDANLAALAENEKGSGNNATDLIVITLGTGVGSGIIANGNILNGVNGTAAEIGHIIVDIDGYLCNCGRKGCLDTVASATGIVQQAMDYIQVNDKSVLAEHYKKNNKIDAKDIFSLASIGDNASEDIINRTTDMLGFSIASAATLINPSAIILGGGVSNAGQPLLNKTIESFNKYALSRISESCEIKLAELGNDAGIIGATCLVKENIC